MHSELYMNIPLHTACRSGSTGILLTSLLLFNHLRFHFYILIYQTVLLSRHLNTQGLLVNLLHGSRTADDASAIYH